MRIVYVSWEYPPAVGGGIGTYVAAAAGGMAARGHDVTVVSVSGSNEPKREVDGLVDVVRLPAPRAGAAGGSGELAEWVDRSRLVAETLFKLTRGGTDVVELPDYRGEGAVWLAQTESGGRPLSIMRLHTPLSVIRAFNPGQAGGPEAETFEHEAIARADRVVCPSGALIAQYRARTGDARVIDVSPHPVDATSLESRPVEPGPRDVVYVGRLEERKGVETLLRAAALFLAARPSARLVLIGADTETSPGHSMLAHLRTLIPSDLLDRVEFAGLLGRTALRERVSAARLCVFPSHFENFPNTCLEAMALGKAVIGTSGTGMAEMMSDGASGFIVPPQDANALATAMTQAFGRSDAELWEVGRCARRRVESEYAPAVTAERTEALYRRYLRERGRTENATVVRRGGNGRVAVVIPCFNHGAFLADAIASVRRQSRAVDELVVVDDGSTDDATQEATAAAAAAGARVIRQENAGLATARNAGVRATDAEFFIPLDADDEIMPRFVERLLPLVQRNETLGYAYSHVERFGSEQEIWKCPAYEPRRLLIESLSCATALVRRSAFDAVDGYNADMTRGFEDWDFWIALLSLGYHGECVPERLFRYRKHAGGSMLTTTERHRPEMMARMVAHHGELMRQMLGIDAPQGAGRGADVHAGLLAHAEIRHIAGSRFWRRFERWHAGRVSGPLARAMLGPIPDAAGDGDPRVRLAAIKASGTWRMIQRIKSTPLYRWFAQRKYGDSADRKPAALS